MHVTLRRYAEVGARMYEMVVRSSKTGSSRNSRPSPASEPLRLRERGRRGRVGHGLRRARAGGQGQRAGARMGAGQPARPAAGPVGGVHGAECGIVEVSRERRAGQPIVVVREFADLGPVEETRDVVRRHALPVITGSPALHQGRAEAIAGAHRGAVRHPGGREALARAVVAGVPRGGGRRGADPAVGGDGARDRLRRGRLGPGERRPPIEVRLRAGVGAAAADARWEWHRPRRA